MLVREKLESSCSFRAISKTFSIAKECLEIDSKIPTHSTIINWVHKIGYHRLQQKKEIADDWIIILDHSIQFGQDKVFVVFGIRESHIDFSRPLRYQDLIPLRIESRKKWNGSIIFEYLKTLEKEIGHIKYAVGDRGADIKKGLKLANIRHVHDITHAIALMLESIYSKDEVFLNFTKQMTTMRQKFVQTNIAQIVPPHQRSKSRYQNIKTISDWGKNAIKYLEHLPDLKNDVEQKIEKEMTWVKNYSVFINELFEINQAICKIEKIIKSEGVSNSSVKESSLILDSFSGSRAEVLKQKLLDYFDETQELINHNDKVLCTSDILESAFGKYKNYVSSNPMAGITNLVLSIAAFTSSMQGNVIKEALEATTINDIKKWTARNIGTTLLQKRRTAFAFV